MENLLDQLGITGPETTNPDFELDYNNPPEDGRDAAVIVGYAEGVDSLKVMHHIQNKLSAYMENKAKEAGIPVEIFSKNLTKDLIDGFEVSKQERTFLCLAVSNSRTVASLVGILNDSTTGSSFEACESLYNNDKVKALHLVILINSIHMDSER